jgi:hypothetical protein
MSTFDPKLLGRVGRYGRQVTHPGDRIEREERRERLMAFDTDGPWRAATEEDMLGTAPVEQDEVSQGINAMIGSAAAEAGARVAAARMSSEQRVASALADELDRREAAKAEKAVPVPGFEAAEADAELATEEQSDDAWAAEAFAEIEREREAEREQQAAAVAAAEEEDEDFWVTDDDDWA